MVLVSIDGFRPDFYLDEKYHAPTLKKLAKNGFYAESMVPVFPTLTYPNHTTLITGVKPSVHGIISNTHFDWKKGPTLQWFWESKYIKVKTINQILEEKGYKTASIHWPVTLNANISYLMPEIFPYKHWYKGKSAWQLVKEFDTNNIVDEINNAKDLKEFKNQHESDAWAITAAKYIVETYKPKLTLLHLTNSDHIQHKLGRNSKELKTVIKTMDNKVKSLLASLDKKTCLMIVGDHGFMNYSKSINLNKLFIDKKWLKINKNGEIISWKVVAHAAGGQAAIYSKDKSITKDIIRLLKDHQYLGYSYISKTELNALGAYPDAIAAISANDGFSISRKLQSKLINDQKQVYGVHGQHPNRKQIQPGFIAHNCELGIGRKVTRIENTKISKIILNYLEI